MVQVIQSGPSAATLRQQALDEALSGAIQGYQKIEENKLKQAQIAKQDALTKRQQALQDAQLAVNLRDKGYDVTPEQVAGLASGTSKLGDLLSTRTTEFQQDRAQKQAEKALEKRYKEAQIADLEASRGINAATKQLSLQKLQQEVNPQKSPEAKLAKVSGETQNKIGGIVTALDSLESLKGAVAQGYGPRYVSPNTPIAGNFVSDDPYSAEERVINEVIGRLQSGGAIGVDEGKNFRDMGPRPSDSPEIARQKIDAQKRFLTNKLNAFGFKAEDIPKLGFETRNPIGQQVDQVNTQNAKSVPSFEEWKKSKGL